MPRLLKITATLANTRMADGTNLPLISTPSLVTFENLASIGISVTRDGADHSLVKSIALMATANTGAVFPIATLAAVDNLAKLKSFQDYVAQVFQQIEEAGDIVTVEARAF